MPRPISPRTIERLRCADPTVRVLTEAQVELRADLRQRKSQWQAADTVTLREHDFASAAALTAVGHTAELTLTNAPAGNSLYIAHYKLTITPDAPASGTNTHLLEVAVETDTAGTGTWVERQVLSYKVGRKAGESETAVVYDHEEAYVRLSGLTSASKLRLKVKSATMPGTSSFRVDPFNKATDGDVTAGVTYHTGPALDFLDDGVTLARNIQTKITHTAHDGFQTDLGGPPGHSGASPFIVARIVWGKDDPRDLAIDRIVAFLHPKQDALQAKTVSEWVCQPFALVTAVSGVIFQKDRVTLVPLADPVRVPAGEGTSAADVTFSWVERTFYVDGRPVVLGRKPRPKSVVPAIQGLVDPQTGLPDLSAFVEYDNGPATFVFIWALQADGTAATNVGWGQDSTVNQVTNGSRKLRAIRLDWDQRGFYQAENVTDGAATRPVLRMRVETGSYANEKIQFSGAGNRIDLGATPTKDVEFSAEAEIPAGSTAIFEVLKDGGVAGNDADWVAYTDGQTTADLANVSKRQTYELRCRMTTNASGDVTPVIRAIGAREITKVPLWDICDFRSCRWEVDPVDLVGRVAEATFVAIKDGDQDFRDRITELLSDNDRGDIVLRTWQGDPSRPRSEWVPLDDFLLDDWFPDAAEVTLVGVSPLSLLKGKLPRYDATTHQRQPKTYANQTPKAIAADIIGTQIGLPARYRGPEIEDESVLLAKTLTESDAKEELDALAYIARGAWTTEAGRIRFVTLLDPGAVVHTFDALELEPLDFSPGFRHAVQEFFVRYGWDDTERRYTGEVLSTVDATLFETVMGTGFKGIARFDASQELRDTVCRWLPTEALAHKIGRLHINAFSLGLRLWRFKSIYRYPELRIGDVVAVPTDRFVMRDPGAGRALRGQLYGIGPIVQVGDPEHQTFGVWVRQIADVVEATEVGTRSGDGTPVLPEVTLNVTQAGAVSLILKATGSLSAKFKVLKTGEPTAAQVRAETAVALDGDGLYRSGTIITLTAGETAFVSAFSYSGSGGLLTESKLATAKITHYEGGVTIDLVEKSRTAYTVTFRLTARDADGDTVKLHYRSLLQTALSESYTSPAPISEGAFSTQPHGLDVTIDRGIADRFIEAWSEDSNGNKSGISRLAIPAITSSDQENAITNFQASGAFQGTCPGQNLVDTITWTEATNIPTGWLAKLFVCSTQGCSPPTTGPFNSDAASGVTRTVLSGVQTGFDFNAFRTYRIRLENGYGELVDDDVSAEISTGYTNC
ncbi:MAG TPA: hypothetical protein VNL18_15505 [Gemmatimonadales bacterium]|nr:hypothetical protein [Gemmatimonadales bacterium]